MVRMQVLFTPEQHLRLRRVAHERGVSMARLIREAVDAQVPDEDAEWRKRRERAFALAGALRSGYTDTAEHHDDVLAEEGW